MSIVKLLVQVLVLAWFDCLLLFPRDLVSKLCYKINTLGISGLYIRCSTSTICLFHDNEGDRKVLTKGVYLEFNYFAVDLDSAFLLNF